MDNGQEVERLFLTNLDTMESFTYGYSSETADSQLESENYHSIDVVNWTTQDCVNWGLGVCRAHNLDSNALNITEKFKGLTGSVLLHYSHFDFYNLLTARLGSTFHQAFVELLNRRGIVSSYPIQGPLTYAPDIDIQPLNDSKLTDLSTVPTDLDLITEFLESESQDMGMQSESDEILLSQNPLLTVKNEDRFYDFNSNLPPLSHQDSFSFGILPQLEGEENTYTYSDNLSPLRRQDTYSHSDYQSPSSLPGAYSYLDHSSPLREPNGHNYGDNVYTVKEEDTYSYTDILSPLREQEIYSSDGNFSPIKEEDTYSYSGDSSPLRDEDPYEYNDHLSQVVPPSPQSFCSSDNESSCLNEDVLGKIKTTSRKRERGPKNWEYLMRMLADKKYNPSIIRWEDKQASTFRIVKPDIVARKWGQRSKKPNLTYDNFARGLRYHYKTGALRAVSERQLVYACGIPALQYLASMKHNKESC